MQEVSWVWKIGWKGWLRGIGWIGWIEWLIPTFDRYNYMEMNLICINLTSLEGSLCRPPTVLDGHTADNLHTFRF